MSPSYYLDEATSRHRIQIPRSARGCWMVREPAVPELDTPSQTWHDVRSGAVENLPGTGGEVGRLV